LRRMEGGLVLTVGPLVLNTSRT